jgi:hypothetical protein
MTKKKQCDRQLPLQTSIPDSSEEDGQVSWEKDITLMSNPLFVKQLLFVAFGAGLLMAIILTSRSRRDALFDLSAGRWDCLK